MEPSSANLSLRHVAIEQQARLERERDEAKQEVLALYQTLAAERRAIRNQRLRGSAGLGALIGTVIGTAVAIAANLSVLPLVPAWILSSVFAFASLASKLKGDNDKQRSPPDLGSEP